jgi:UDP-2,3-diacylglucosamine hydrolase
MRPETLFISDLHLSAARPEAVRRFLGFLAARAQGAERLYILGDLFDAYLGDDDDSKPNRDLKAALRRVADSGTQVFFQHGNRDFLVGERFARETGAGLLGDYAVIDLYGVPALLTHGDLLCTDDVQYLAARARVRAEGWKRDALGKPLWMRRLYARWYRVKSGLDKRGKSREIMDVNADAVAATLRGHGVARLIHGHTHRPRVHDFEIDGKPCQRFVLPEWDGGEWALRFDAGGYQREAIAAP